MKQYVIDKLKRRKIPRGNLEEMLHTKYSQEQLEDLRRVLSKEEMNMDKELTQESENLKYYIRAIIRVKNEKKQEQTKNYNPFDFFAKKKDVTKLLEAA